MTALIGVMPRPGDLVHITDRAGIAYAEHPIPRFRVIEAELMPGWEGWCRLRGYDTDTIADPHAGDIDYRWHRVCIAGLVVYPGDGWRTDG